jgi:hypothetical protein
MGASGHYEQSRPIIQFILMKIIRRTNAPRRWSYASGVRVMRLKNVTDGK